MSDSSSSDELNEYPRILELGVETPLPPDKKWVPPQRILNAAYVKACKGVPLDKVGQLKEVIEAVFLTDPDFISRSQARDVVNKIMSYSESSSSEDELTSSSEDDYPQPGAYQSQWLSPQHSEDSTSTSESTSEEEDSSSED